MEKEYTGKDAHKISWGISRLSFQGKASSIYNLSSRYETLGGKRHEAIKVFSLTTPPMAAVEYYLREKLNKVSLIGREEDISEIEQEVKAYEKEFEENLRRDSA